MPFARTCNRGSGLAKARIELIDVSRRENFGEDRGSRRRCRQPSLLIVEGFGPLPKTARVSFSWWKTGLSQQNCFNQADIRSNNEQADLTSIYDKTGLKQETGGDHE